MKMDLSRSRMVLELLTKVLDFYANPKNYNKIKREGIEVLTPSLVEIDAGTKAQDTRRNIQEIMGLANKSLAEIKEYEHD